MSNTYYNLYVDNCIKFARTVIIKNEYSIANMNKKIVENGYEFNEYDPSTWYYYKNLNGEYHPANGQVMKVRSLDTTEIIEFTKENLNIHRTTRKAYVFGTEHYFELVKKYPHNQLLITRIINPIDYHYALNAPDNKILWYDKSLVESNEYNLIDELQKWIDAYFLNVNPSAYGEYHNLYEASKLGIMYVNLPMALINIRLNNAHTPYAHSFHIWSYLGSHQRLDRYKEFLTKNQSLHLYRNINWIEKNAGRGQAFEKIIQYILTERRIPIGEYHLFQNDENMPEDIFPTPEMVRNPLNLEFYNNPRGVFDTVDNVVFKEIPIAKDNHLFVNESIQRIKEEIKTNIVTDLPTKVLESEMIDLSNSASFTLEEIRLNEWIHLSSRNLYNPIMGILNPVTSETMMMDAKKAWILWYYAFNRTLGWDLQYIPEIFVALDVIFIPKPKWKDLTSIVESKHIDNEFIYTVIDHTPDIGKVVSIEEFAELTDAIFKSKTMLRQLYCSLEHRDARAQGEALVKRFYNDRPCKVNTLGFKTFQEFFESEGWYLDEITDNECFELANNIINKVTGADLKVEQSLRDIQKAMLEITQFLSSYTVQVLQTMHDEKTVNLDWKHTRVGDHFGVAHGNIKVPVEITPIIDHHGVGHSSIKFQEAEKGIQFDTKMLMLGHWKINPTIEIDLQPDRINNLYQKRIPINTDLRPKEKINIKDIITKTVLNQEIEIDWDNPTWVNVNKLISINNNINLTTKDISIREINNLTNSPIGVDVSALIEAKNNSGYEGKVYVQYAKVDLTPHSKSFEIQAQPFEHWDRKRILDFLNNNGYNFVLEDFDDSIEVVLESLPLVHKLKVSNNSVYWKNGNIILNFTEEK